MAMLRVEVLSAHQLDDHDAIGRQDPYCIIRLGEETERTETDRSGGRSPTWTDGEGRVEFGLPDNLDQRLVITIMDEDCTADDFVGEACLNLAEVVRRCAASEECSWVGEVQVFRKGANERGTLNLQVEIADATGEDLTSMLNDVPEKFLEPVPVSINKNWAEGAVQAMQEGDEATDFLTYHVALHGVKETFEDVWQYGKDGQHPDTFQDDLEGNAILAALSAVHHVIYHPGHRAESRWLSSGEDFLRMLNNGVRGDRSRVFTYALMDDGLFFSETGAALSKDSLSKHAIHADGAKQVRYSGTFRICRKGHLFWKSLVLVIDNDSGTYMPKEDAQPMLKQVLERNFPGLHVETLSVVNPQPPETLGFHGPIEDKEDPLAVYAGTWRWHAHVGGVDEATPDE